MAISLTQLGNVQHSIVQRWSRGHKARGQGQGQGHKKIRGQGQGQGQPF